MKQRTYIAIDLKSFYASVECRERKLDPLDTNLVVADESRTDKTICLAVTPSLKSCGIPGRARLFEVKQRVREANTERRYRAPGRRLTGSSCFRSELDADPNLAIDFLIAPPRMAHYMAYSTKIYAIYMKYVAPEDVLVYSIDEVFMDVTDYLKTYAMPPRDLAKKLCGRCWTPRVLPRRRASEPICSSARLPWTLWRNTYPQTKTAFGSPSWTR